MARRVRDHRWRETPLGVAEQWPDRLTAVIELVLASATVSSVAVGPERLLIYNDAAAKLYGSRHPEALGQPLAKIFPESYPAVAALYERVFAGEALQVRAQPLAISNEGGEVFDAYLTPVRNAAGEVIAAHMVGMELGERGQAEVALRESQERQAFLLELSDTMRSQAEADAIIAAASRLLGQRLGASRVVFAEIDDTAGVAHIRRGWEADGAEAHPLVLRLEDFGGPLLSDLRAGRTVRSDDVGPPPYARSDLAALAAIGVKAALSVPLVIGGRFVVNLTVQQHGPRRWTDAEVALVEDVSERLWAAVERARAEAVARDSEQRQRVLIEGVPQLVWRANADGNWTWTSPQWTQFTGQDEASSHGSGWLEAVHPNDRERLRESWARASGRGEFHADFRIRRAHDGRHHWFQTRATPVRDRAGLIIEWLGTCTDVEDLRSLQERQRVLLFELQHRVRNTLSVVRSMASSTGRTSDTVADFAAHLEGRLNALARTQMVLTRSPGQDVDLEGLVREELLAQAASERHFDIQGPEVRLSAKATEVLTLAIHELATNSVKYGALSADAGKVAVSWSTSQRDDHLWLLLTWRETGVRILTSAPRRSGFGTELIEMRVPYELKGQGRIEFLPGGVCCRVEFPLIPGASILQTTAPGQGA